MEQNAALLKKKNKQQQQTTKNISSLILGYSWLSFYES